MKLGSLSPIAGAKIDGPILESAQSGDQSVYNFGSKSNFTSAFLTPQAHELFTPKSNIDNKQNSFRGLEGYSYPEL